MRLPHEFRIVIDGANDLDMWQICDAEKTLFFGVEEMEADMAPLHGKNVFPPIHLQDVTFIDVAVLAGDSYAFPYRLPVDERPELLPQVADLLVAGLDMPPLSIDFSSKFDLSHVLAFLIAIQCQLARTRAKYAWMRSMFSGGKSATNSPGGKSPLRASQARQAGTQLLAVVPPPAATGT